MAQSGSLMFDLLLERRPFGFLLLGILMLTSYSLSAAPAAQGLDHSDWDAQLRRYVRGDHRVDYARWKQEGLPSLDAYISQLAAPFPKQSTSPERHAALINAYNALTIRWVLTHFPTKSIWKTKKPFTAKRHAVNGKVVSLDDIETELRQTMGPLTHSVLVCAARSCPPLRREAYVAARLEEQLEDNTLAWLRNPALNQFDSVNATASVSSIFKWYRQDFDADGATLEDFLLRYAPNNMASFLKSGNKSKIRFLNYDWGLNDNGAEGENYRGFYLDYLRNK